MADLNDSPDRAGRDRVASRVASRVEVVEVSRDSSTGPPLASSRAAVVPVPRVARHARNIRYPTSQPFIDRRVHRDARVWWCVVTVRVTTLKGADAGSYYVEQLPNYYLDSGEPRGVWLGAATTELGLAGQVDDDSFLALMAGKDPRRPDQDLGRRFDEKSVRGFDVTASVPLCRTRHKFRSRCRCCSLSATGTFAARWSPLPTRWLRYVSSQRGWMCNGSGVERLC